MLPISREEDNLKLNLVTLINTFNNCSSVYDGRCKTDRRMSIGKIDIPSDLEDTVWELPPTHFSAIIVALVRSMHL